MRSPSQVVRAAAANSAPCVVVCESLWMAEAITRNLELTCSAILRLRQVATDLPRLASVSRSPKVAIIVESDGRMVGRAVRPLRRCWPDIKVLVVGLPNQEDAILHSLAAHIDGIVLAEESLEQLAAAIRDVRANTFRSPPQLIRPLFNRLVRLPPPPNAAPWKPSINRLSTRELQVLAFIERGESNKAIAAQLFIEEHTVKNHVTQILRKLGVRTRYDAARIAADVRVQRCGGESRDSTRARSGLMGSRSPI